MAEVKTICIEALERHCNSGETGRLDFHRSELEGQIFTREGLIVHAQLGGLDGIPALFRLFDWGDADAMWNPGVETEQTSLNLDCEQAGVMYAEHLQERNAMEVQEQEKLNEAFATTSLVSSYESVLKHYTIRLECVESSLLPGGFTFADSTKHSYVIGSSEDCDVVIRHASVDPLHCGVILEGGSVYIWDLGSQSGIRLNSAPVAEAKLKVGDTMSLGAVDFRVRFQLRRPNIQRPKTLPMPPANATQPVQKGPPSKEIPKGAISYDKATRQLKDSGKGGSFLGKLGSMFGGKK